MQPYQNPYESPQTQLNDAASRMPVAGPIQGTEDQRMAFPNNTTVELRRWKQHYNSLILFVIGLVVTLLGCVGTGIFLFAKAGPDGKLYLAGVIFLLALGIASLIGVMNRAAWTAPLIWLWIGIWSLLCIVGAVLSLNSNIPEALIGVLQLLVYVIVLIVFVGKAVAEAHRIFGPERIDEYQLKEELAYREMNSIP